MNPFTFFRIFRLINFYKKLTFIFNMLFNKFCVKK